MTCATCGRDVDALDPVTGVCTTCATTAAAPPAAAGGAERTTPVAPGTRSVRPPDAHDTDAVADRDPLAGWDLPGSGGATSPPPPPTWGMVAGAAGLAGLVGIGAARGPGGVLRRGLAWSLLGATLAGVALRVWELPEEPATWATRLGS